MKLYFLVIECINKSLLCHRKHIKYVFRNTLNMCDFIYKINKLFLVTLWFRL